jgi:hypothetical protein
LVSTLRSVTQLNQFLGLISWRLGHAGGEQPPFPDVTIRFTYLDADCGATAVTQEILVESILAVYDGFDSLYHYDEILLPFGNDKFTASAEGYEDIMGNFEVIDNVDSRSEIAITLQ